MPNKDGYPTKEEYDQVESELKALAKNKLWSEKRGNWKRARYEAYRDYLEKRKAEVKK